jgi:hypothetical protein
MIGLVVKGLYVSIYNAAIMSVFWLGYTFIEVKYNLYMNNYVRAIAMFTTASDSFFGHFLQLYITSSVFDKLLHLFGSYSFSLFAYVLVIQMQRPVTSKLFNFILVFSLGLSLGVLYEITEFLGDTFTRPAIPAQTSLLDTDLDLISDIIGSSLGGFHAVNANIVPRYKTRR